MARTIYEFTEEERHRIDEAYRANLEGLSADDVRLLQEWEAARALESSEHQARLDAIKAESDAHVAQAQARADQAAANLAEMHAAMMARLEAVKHGQEE